MVHGFEHRQPKQPRLLSLAAHANPIPEGISSVYTTGTSLYVSGGHVGLIELDGSQPRHTINLF
jgi:hypothetical protein